MTFAYQSRAMLQQPNQSHCRLEFTSKRQPTFLHRLHSAKHFCCCCRRRLCTFFSLFLFCRLEKLFLDSPNCIEMTGYAPRYGLNMFWCKVWCLVRHFWLEGAGFSSKDNSLDYIYSTQSSFSLNPSTLVHSNVERSNPTSSERKLGSRTHNFLSFE